MEIGEIILDLANVEVVLHECAIVSFHRFFVKKGKGILFDPYSVNGKCTSHPFLRGYVYMSPSGTRLMLSVPLGECCPLSSASGGGYCVKRKREGYTSTLKEATCFPFPDSASLPSHFVFVLLVYQSCCYVIVLRHAMRIDG